MECGDAVELLLARLSGNPSGREAQRLDEHLAGCPACRMEAAELEHTWLKLGADEDARVSPELRRDTLALLEAETLRRKVRHLAPRTWRWSAQAAAALAIGVGGFLLARISTRSAPSGVPSLASSAAGAPAAPASSAGPLANASLTTSGGPSGPVAIPASPQIVATLIETLRQDRSPGVRKKAAEALAQLPPNVQIRNAFLAALKSDANPAIRIVAVEALGKEAVTLRDPQAIETLREKAADANENGFVRVQAASLLKKVDL